MNDSTMLDHVKTMTEIDSRSKSNKHRIDKIEEITIQIHALVQSIKDIADNNKLLLQGQNKQNDKISKLEIDVIKAIDVKEGLSRLHDKMDDFDKRIDSNEDSRIKLTSEIKEELYDLKSVSGNKAEKTLNQIKWLLISLTVAGAFGVIWNLIIA